MEVEESTIYFTFLQKWNWGWGGGGEFAWKLVWMCGCGVVSATTPIGGNLATGRGENEQKQLRRYGLHH